MYLPDTEIEIDALRQGDIVTNIQILGAINLNSVKYTSSIQTPDKTDSWTVAAPPTIGDAMVLSHSCEIAKENGVKLTSIILAPLRDVSSATAPEKVTELIESNIINPSNPSATYLKYFYIESHPDMQYRNGAVVDFSKCFSLRKQNLDYLIDHKKAQLELSLVNSMSLKFALYFHRELGAVA